MLIGAITSHVAHAGPEKEVSFPQGTLSREETIVSSQNAKSYRELIIPELAPYVRSGALEFPAVDELRKEPEGEATGRKEPLLWRVQNALARLKVIDADLDIIALKENRVLREFKGNFVRVYPTELSPPEKNIQIFRERLTLDTPSALSGYSMLTYRFSGNDEDGYWTYSPAIKKTRELTGTNRTDGIMSTGIALDDLFGWSGKEELVVPDKEETTRGFAPFARSDSLVPRAAGVCREVLQETPEEGSKGSGPRWNFAARRFPTAAPWIPTTGVFIPRDLIRVELGSRDPYSRYGREVLYVDKQTLLPFYKFVFDRAGHPWKTVLSGYGVMEGDAKNATRLIPTFTIVDDLLKGESYIIEFSKISSCEALPERLKSGFFDPRKLGENSEGHEK